MNPGAFLMDPAVLTPSELEQAAAQARALAASKENVHKAGRYAGLRWFQVNLAPTDPACRAVLSNLGITAEPELLVFYYLEPGARIHRHRDLSGAALNNRIRFHVPIITNDRVDFRVAGDRIEMRPGELWCLDTSYAHSVENGGSEERVHLVVECGITPELRQRLPGGLGAFVHTMAFAGLMAGNFAHALFWNSVRDPAYFKDQMKMVFRFIGWRLLKIGRPR